MKTARGEPCKVPADRFYHDEWLCHLHDPRGKHQAHQGKYRRRRLEKTRREEHPEFHPEPVAPLVEDHTLAMFAPPTAEQARVLKLRMAAWRRQSAKTAQTEPKASKPPVPASDALHPRYAR